MTLYLTLFLKKKGLKRLVQSNSMAEKTRKCYDRFMSGTSIRGKVNCPKFIKTLSALNTCTYRLAKFWVPCLKPLTTNEVTTKNYFHFAEQIVDQRPDHFMGSLDVDSLFTNINLEETIKTCIWKYEICNLTNKIFKILKPLKT